MTLFKHGDHVLWHSPDGPKRGIVNVGDEPPHESVHGTLYEVVLLDDQLIVADEEFLERISAVDLLAGLVSDG